MLAPKGIREAYIRLGPSLVEKCQNRQRGTEPRVLVHGRCAVVPKIKRCRLRGPRKFSISAALKISDRNIAAIAGDCMDAFYVQKWRCTPARFE